MAQFTYSWDNTDVLANSNNTGQIASYRRKSIGGSWITTGFTPSNTMAKSVTSALTPTSLLDNNVYEFKLEAICTAGGPIMDDNGIRENIAFACIDPVIENSDVASQITLVLTGTDITKAIFTLRKSSDNTIAYGPTTVNRIGANAVAIAGGLTPATDYYWQVSLLAIVNGVEVISSSANYLNSVCGPYTITTNVARTQHLVWVPDTQVCETEGGFDIQRTITGLSSPITSWYDTTNSRLYVVDHDDPAGNIYWLNPFTANTVADATHSTAIVDNKIYNAYIDGLNRKIYLVGANTGGLKVYDIDTNSIVTVAFGTNGDFQRILLTVTTDYIYCNDGTTSIIRIDRNSLSILNTIAISGIASNAHFTLDVNIIEGNNKLYVLNNNNASISTIGVYSMDLATHIGEITLPGSSIWAGGFSHYWQTGFYDKTSGNLYIGDIGSSKRYIINSANTVIHNVTTINKQGKSNVINSWTINPITNDLMFLYTGVNSSSDASPIKRAYIEDRNTHSYTRMFENQAYTGLSQVFGTNSVAGANPGQVYWNLDPSYSTDGVITILSTSVGTHTTGRLITVTLKQVDTNSGNTPTGSTKNNIVGDTDYVPPTNNFTVCSVVNTLTCPTDLVATFQGTTLDYEFSIATSVKNNPAVDKIQVYSYNINTASVEGAPQVISSPFATHYYKGQFVGLGGSNYGIQIVYLDNTGAVLQTC
jgi:hypothetical protein